MTERQAFRETLNKLHEGHNAVKPQQKKSSGSKSSKKVSRKATSFKESESHEADLGTGKSQKQKRPPNKSNAQNEAEKEALQHRYGQLTLEPVSRQTSCELEQQLNIETVADIEQTPEVMPGIKRAAELKTLDTRQGGRLSAFRLQKPSIASSIAQDVDQSQHQDIEGWQHNSPSLKVTTPVLVRQPSALQAQQAVSLPNGSPMSVGDTLQQGPGLEVRIPQNSVACLVTGSACTSLC
jgi:hypothetical protein